MKSPPRYFVPITWIHKLAQFFSQEAELIGGISRINSRLEQRRGRTFTFRALDYTSGQKEQCGVAPNDLQSNNNTTRAITRHVAVPGSRIHFVIILQKQTAE